MRWSKTKQLMEERIAPSLKGRVAYTVSSYRFAHDKSGRANLTVDTVEVFNLSKDTPIRWYTSDQEAKKDPSVELPVEETLMDAIRKQGIPEERVPLVAGQRKRVVWGEAVYKAQSGLFKTDFTKEAERYLTCSLEQALESDDILMNIFALIDGRLGKKRLRNMCAKIKYKHPAVQYFYRIRCEAEHIIFE